MASADTIADFTDGTVILGLNGGFQYSDLIIAQSLGNNSSHSIISITSSSEYLTILEGISASDLNGFDIILIT